MPRSTLRQRRAGTLLPLLGLCAFLAVGTGAASDAPLPEVTVIGKMDAHTANHLINQFIESHAKPSAVIGQVGRWREGVCPAVFGLQGRYADFVTGRITALARSVGAPTAPVGRKCAANVEVVVTPEPQALLDGIAKKYRSLLGYYPAAQSREATTFNHPVQAWYLTGSRTLNGFQPPKMGAGGGPPSSSGGHGEGGLPQEQAGIQPFITGLVIDSEESATGGDGRGPTGTAGSRLSHGLRSEFVHVLIIADARAVGRYPLQTLADYVGLLALTRIVSPDSCTELPSILNLFAAHCATPPTALTLSDMVYLQALYGADLDHNLNVQQGAMRERMFQAIASK